MGGELFAALFVVAMCGGAFAQNSEPVVSPTATPAPPTPPVKNQTYILKDKNDEKHVCLRMSVAIVVNITYINSEKKNVSKKVALTDASAIDKDLSYCYSKSTNATLVIVPDDGDDEMGTFRIIFRFTGDNSTGNNHWAWSNISFSVDPEYLDGYDDKMDTLDFDTADALHEEPNSMIEFDRSYFCNSSQVLNFTKANSVNPFVYVSNLQAQAFNFTNPINGTFDNARTCLLDTAGQANKIVPIAVGAALAGLVVVVLIAYLIGRLRSRRQSSYEALS